jgi:hypothetical protein
MDKMPTYQWRDARRLAGFLRTDGPMIAKELEPQMRAVLEKGEELPDLAHLLDVLGRMVIAAQARVEEKDDDKGEYATEVALARKELRQQSMPVLRSRVQEVRKLMNAHMSRETVRRVLGGEGRTPRSDEGLENLATGMVRRLEVLKPIPTPGGGSVDPAAWAEYLSEPLDRVSDLLIDMDVYGGGASAMVEKKGEAMKSYLKLFRQTARVGWIFCHMADLEHAARQLVYDGGRTAEKIKPRQGPVNVA